MNGIKIPSGVEGIQKGDLLCKGNVITGQCATIYESDMDISVLIIKDSKVKCGHILDDGETCAHRTHVNGKTTKCRILELNEQLSIIPLNNQKEAA